MAAPDAETQTRVANWYASLDPAFQGVLEAIYAEAPEAVSKVISGGTWAADAGDAPLGELLAGGDGFNYQGLMLGGADITPWPLTAGATLNISIPLEHQGKHDHPAFETIVTWTTPSGASETRTIQTEAIAPGGSTSVDLEIGDLEEGLYDLRFDINPGGAPLGAPPNEAGTRYEYPMPLQVSSTEQGAEQQDDTAWGAAQNLLTTLINAPHTATESLREALNWLATIELGAEERQVVETAATRVDRLAEIDASGQGRPQQVDDALTAVGVAASRVLWNDAENRAPVMNALDELSMTLMG
jgi:hypothetical protein